MWRIRDVNAVCNGRQGKLDAFGVLNLHPCGSCARIGAVTRGVPDADHIFAQ
jgi:hypothetical protein